MNYQIMITVLQNGFNCNRSYNDNIVFRHIKDYDEILALILICNCKPCALILRLMIFSLKGNWNKYLKPQIFSNCLCTSF